MAPALTDITPYDADESALALAREMQPLWRKAASLMIGTDYYPLTECRKAAEDFYAAQFHDPAAERGLVHLINGAAAVETDFTIALKGLDPNARYELTSAESHDLRTFAGEQLLAGVPLHLDKKAADLWFYSKV